MLMEPLSSITVTVGGSWEPKLTPIGKANRSADSIGVFFVGGNMLISRTEELLGWFVLLVLVLSGLSAGACLIVMLLKLVSSVVILTWEVLVIWLVLSIVVQFGARALFSGLMG